MHRTYRGFRCRRRARARSHMERDDGLEGRPQGERDNERFEKDDKRGAKMTRRRK